ncbi:MAG: xylan 1,4-beta-xylosidase, partial [Lachnospiraceae bacterium]|nr:xylan 1,4-beta-xylosidase [Lachnospiraceae bacterium]
FITEKDIFNRPIVNICDGAVIGFKYFDFGVDYSNSTVSVCIETFGVGQTGEIHVRLDSEDGEEIGCGKILEADGVTKIKLKPITGSHAVYFVVKHGRTSWIKDSFANRNLCSINRILFIR